LGGIFLHFKSKYKFQIAPYSKVLWRRQEVL